MFSVVLLAAVNANHQLVVPDEGTIGKVFGSLKEEEQTSLLPKCYLILPTNITSCSLVMKHSL
jgi:hypothetical protein